MSSRNKKPILENVLIEQVAAEGKSMAYVNGKVLFVPLAIPGDVADVQLTRIKRSFMEGYVVRLVKPSPDRLNPFCIHYGVCGGCKWQPLPYPLQLKYKQQQVIDQLTRIGKLKLPSISPIVGSAKTEHYRNKLEFTFSDRRWLLEGEDPDSVFSPHILLNKSDFPDGFPRHLKNGFSSVNTNYEGFGLGFHVEGLFDKVLDISECHLQNSPSNAIRNFVKEYAIAHKIPFFNLREQTGILRNLIIRNNTAGDFMVILVVTSLGEKVPSPIFDLLSELKNKFLQIKSLYYVINSKRNDAVSDLPALLFAGEDAIYEEMEGLKFKIGPKSFFQTNSEQAYRLYSIGRELAQLNGDELIYDLYTGTGTIALFLSKLARKVIGVEYVPEAIEDARINATNNNITNCEFHCGDMKDILTDEFVSQNGTPDLLVLDPPRAGVHPDVIKVILNANPSKILYISCNPATQARDIASFSEQYEVVAVVPVDMFPHTQHVENVVMLRKIS